MRRFRRTPGISRIDQPEKRTHGFFVRVQRQGKTHSAFFTDQRYGGKKRALAAAQKHYRKLVAKLGPVVRRRMKGPRRPVARRKAFSVSNRSHRARTTARRARRGRSRK